MQKLKGFPTCSHYLKKIPTNPHHHFQQPKPPLQIPTAILVSQNPPTDSHCHISITKSPHRFPPPYRYLKIPTDSYRHISILKSPTGPHHSSLYQSLSPPPRANFPIGERCPLQLDGSGRERCRSTPRNGPCKEPTKAL